MSESPPKSILRRKKDAIVTSPNDVSDPSNAFELSVPKSHGASSKRAVHFEKEPGTPSSADVTQENLSLSITSESPSSFC